MFEKRLSKLAFVHDGFSAFKRERKARQAQHKEKNDYRLHRFSVPVPTKKGSQRKAIIVLVSDGPHRLWHCPLFMNMNVIDRYVAVRKQRLCNGCLGKGHALKDCKVNACGINGCT